MLYLIGLGLGGEDDITEAGLKAVLECDLIFLEAYTSVLGVDRAALEAKVHRPARACQCTELSRAPPVWQAYCECGA